jgi:S1-C subfamily serine protease
MKSSAYLLFIAIVSNLFLLSPTHAQGTNPSEPTSLRLTQTTTSSDREIVTKIDKIAQQITVRIDSQNSGNGSGTIVAKQGQTYYVLTANHVVDRSRTQKGCQFDIPQGQEQYRLTTPDGENYAIQPSAIVCQDGVDLAVVQFTSPKEYTVATVAKYNIAIGKTTDEEKWVFVSGFPASESQRRLTAGKVLTKEQGAISAKDAFSLAENSGYELVYSNLSLPGMSGAPVLDSRGRLVGINAAAENEFESDGNNKVSEISLGKSLGVSITTFLELLEQLKVNPAWLTVENTVPSPLNESQEADIRDSLFNLNVGLDAPSS